MKLIRGMRFILDFNWNSEKIQKEIESDFKNADEILSRMEKLPNSYKFQKLFHDLMVVKRTMNESLAECPTFDDRDKLIEFLRGIKNNNQPIDGCDYRPFNLQNYKKYWDKEIDSMIYRHEQELYGFFRPKRSRYADYNKSSATLI